MAKVKIEELIDDLSTDMRKALGATVRQAYPNVEVDERALFKIFLKAVRKRCNTWETVRDSYVQVDQD